jgi:hypothetical protein
MAGMAVTRAKRNDPYFKQLLIDIEESNLLREELTFRDICRVRPNYYDANEHLKKKYKGEVDQIKRKTLSAYFKLLDTFGVPVGPALQRFNRKNHVSSSKKKPEPSSNSSSASSSSSSSSEVSASNDESVATTTVSASNNESAVATATEWLKEISITKEIDTPKKEIERIEEQTPPSSILKKKKIMFSPDGSVTSNPVADVLNYVELLEGIRQEGTSDYPFLWIVNHEYPERNNGFDIHLVPEIEHRGHTRAGFDIRLTVPVANSNEWEGFIPSAKYPTMAKRAVMIRGPSQDSFIQDTERYHKDKNTIDCEPTKKKHLATEQAIKDDPSRQLVHTLLIFKKGTNLENHVFSDDAIDITVQVNDMIASVDNGDGESLEVMGTTLFWRIAVAGGSKLAAAKKGKKLFKKKAAAATSVN